MQEAQQQEPAAEVAAIEAESARLAARLGEARRRAAAETQRSVDERAWPFRHEAELLEAQLAELDAQADAVLHEAIRKGRELYARHVQIQAQRAALNNKIQAITGTPTPFFGVGYESRGRKFESCWAHSKFPPQPQQLAIPPRRR